MEETPSVVNGSPEREIVLFLDGTGNTFRGDGTETNILKMFKMLDRTKENRCKFCQLYPFYEASILILENSLLLSTYCSYEPYSYKETTQKQPVLEQMSPLHPSSM
jgi:hypothetical protein